MGKNRTTDITIDQRLATLHFICDNKSHITLDVELCKKCKNKSCTFFCPGDVYVIQNESEAPAIDYENCLECGTCRISCPMGAISWNYPEGSKGVRFRFG